jgi:peptidoglycan/xylan/chitin deacetylase (PgdA/CDA1 family)
MAKRWKSGPLHAIKRGITSLFVCIVVLLPLIFTGVQLGRMFAKPQDNRKATALPALNVRTIDKSSAPIKPFDEPLITVTFDDGWETVYTQAMPLLQNNGIPTTQYILSGVENDQHYLSFAQVKSIKQSGHEIACHTISHPDLTTLNQTELLQQLNGCKLTLQKELGGNSQVREFASPFGHNNDQTMAAIKQVFRSSRNTNGDIITNQADDQDINTRANFDRYNIIAVTLRGDTTVGQLQAAIDYTVKHNGWLVLNYHQIEESDTSKFALTDKLLQKQLQAVNRAPARIVTMGQALDALDK